MMIKIKIYNSFKSWNNLAPSFLSELIMPISLSQILQVYKGFLRIPQSNQKTYGDRAFSSLSNQAVKRSVSTFLFLR